MTRLAQTDALNSDQVAILAAVHDFVENEIIPVAQQLEQRDEYPQAIVDGLRELGVFGLVIPEEFGGLGESLLTYALVVEEIARGWMSVSGVINTHFIVAHMLMQHGTPEQKQRYLPGMALGEIRGAFSMSEPGCGSDVAGITSRGMRTDAGWSLTGQKMWLTNGGTATLVAVLVRTDAEAADGASVYQKMTTFLVEKPSGFGQVLPGLTIPGKIEKMGYKGVDTTEFVMDGMELPPDAVLGGIPGRGFYQMMDGVEVGRVNVAARACGMSIRAFELAVEYAQHRQSFGKPIAEHQAVAFRLADMAVKVEAAHQMMVFAARKKDSGDRTDMEAGMAKLFASEAALSNATEAMRVHGGYGYSEEFDVERYYRDAPLMCIGEGTNEIQRVLIARELVKRFPA